MIDVRSRSRSARQDCVQKRFEFAEPAVYSLVSFHSHALLPLNKMSRVRRFAMGRAWGAGAGLARHPF